MRPLFWAVLVGTCLTQSGRCAAPPPSAEQAEKQALAALRGAEVTIKREVAADGTVTYVAVVKWLKEQNAVRVLAPLKYLSGLREVQLNGSFDGPKMGDTHVRALLGLRELKSLVLDQLRVTDECLGQLSRLTGLRELEVGFCDSVTDKGMIRLGALVRLRFALEWRGLREMRSEAEIQISRQLPKLQQTLLQRGQGRDVADQLTGHQQDRQVDPFERLQQ